MFWVMLVGQSVCPPDYLKSNERISIKLSPEIHQRCVVGTGTIHYIMRMVRISIWIQNPDHMDW